MNTQITVKMMTAPNDRSEYTWQVEWFNATDGELGEYGLVTFEAASRIVERLLSE